MVFASADIHGCEPNFIIYSVSDSRLLQLKSNVKVFISPNNRLIAPSSGSLFLGSYVLHIYCGGIRNACTASSIQSRSHVVGDDQSTCLSWCQASILGLWPEFYLSVEDHLCGAPPLPRGCAVIYNRCWRMAYCRMLRRVALVRTDISDEFSASFIRVTRIVTYLFLLSWWRRH
jgi:hypothetical protein